MEPQVEAQIERVAAVVRDVLGPDVVAIYLYGSAVRGGLRPASDLDLLAVTTRPTTPEERGRLVDGLAPISNRELRERDWRPVELTLVVEGDVMPWHYPPRVDFQYGEWLRAAFAARNFDPEPRTHSDLVVLLAMARQSAIALSGPSLSELVEPIPTADLRRAMTAGVGDLLGDLDDDTANVLLTLARIWATLATGRFMSKDEAADWAAAHLSGDELQALIKARDVYLGASADEWSRADGAGACAQVLIRAIDEAG